MADADDGHQFHFAVSIQGSSAVVGEPHRDVDWIGEPFKLTVRAWSLSEACAKAAAVPLPGWTLPDDDDDDESPDGS